MEYSIIRRTKWITTTCNYMNDSHKPDVEKQKPATDYTWCDPLIEKKHQEQADSSGKVRRDVTLLRR